MLLALAAIAVLQAGAAQAAPAPAPVVIDMPIPKVVTGAKAPPIWSAPARTTRLRPRSAASSFSIR
jgi:hypothetical protein